MLKRLFGYDPKVTSVRRELLAGLTTFLAMSYILAVNPAMLADAGMDWGAVFTATALAAAISTLLVAVYVKLPLAQAPGMGLNAFFAYTLVIGMGYSWQQALAAVFIEGVIFILLTVFNVREKVMNAIPTTIQKTVGIGIGFLIAIIGLESAGIIVASESTFIAMGELTTAVLIALGGIVLSGILLTLRVKGALFLGIIITTIVSLICGVVAIPEGFAIFSMPHSIEPTLFKFDFSQIFTLDMVIAILLLLFMDMFDTIGTLVATLNKLSKPNEEGKFPRVKQAMLSDAVGTTVGSILGTSTVTTFLESTVGIAEGGRSGLTALSTALFFLLALFLAPLFMLIPAVAITGALVSVGVMMVGDIKVLSNDDFSEVMPGFLTIIMMIATSSIAEGISAGVVSYVLIKACSGRYKELSLPIYIIAALMIARYFVI
ncbi:MAG: NCS2 family permease [Bacteroidales bacterium]